MRWNKHIDIITAKANRKLGFVKRNVNINNREVTAHAYKSLVRPILEYSRDSLGSIHCVRNKTARICTAASSKIHNESLSEKLQRLYHIART